MGFFEVSKEGLAKLLERRGKSFAVLELVQNCWDQNVTTVTVKLTPVDNKPACLLEVLDDDPDGFSDLSHAYTLFAESEKKINPEKRGRFNLGEKLVLAICNKATISSTTGTIEFANGERMRSKKKRHAGSLFSGELRMTRAEFEQACIEVKKLIPPAGITTTFNGEPLLHREPIHRFTVALATEQADAEGFLRPTKRQTEVRVYERFNGEPGALYEMGLPVVDTDDKWHVDIGQKVPLNTDRDNVTPAYLRAVRTSVFNEMHTLIEPEDAAEPWVREATSDKRCSSEAISTALDHRFGKKRVVYDPSDPEANKRAMAEGYHVISGGSLNAIEWSNVKGAGAALPAGQVTPSPKPFHPGGEPLKTLSEAKWTPEMQATVAYAKRLGLLLLKKTPQVQLANDSGWGFNASYGSSGLIINVARVGKAWFSATPWTGVGINRLLIHEFGHHFSDDHFSPQYHDALCKLGAQMVNLASEGKLAE